MNQKKNHSLKATYILFSLAAFGLIILLILGIRLANTALMTFSSEGETVLTITKEQEYYVLLDTNGVRDEIQVGLYDVVNYVIIKNENDEDTYTNLVLITSETDPSVLEIEQIEFDKQIMRKGYLSFGLITLKEGTYTFDTQKLIVGEDIGEFAILGANYVKNIGFFSFSAIATFTFALLGFKSYKNYEKRPLSKYVKKRIK